MHTALIFKITNLPVLMMLIACSGKHPLSSTQNQNNASKDECAVSMRSVNRSAVLRILDEARSQQLQSMRSLPPREWAVQAWDAFGVQDCQAAFASVFALPWMTLPSEIYPERWWAPDFHEGAISEVKYEACAIEMCKIHVSQMLSDSEMLRKYHQAVLWSRLFYGVRPLTKMHDVAKDTFEGLSAAEAESNPWWWYVRNAVLIMHLFEGEGVIIGSDPQAIARNYIGWYKQTFSGVAKAIESAESITEFGSVGIIIMNEPFDDCEYGAVWPIIHEWLLLMP